MSENNYKIWSLERRGKQLVMSVVFIAVLVLGWVFPLLGFSILLCMLFGIAIGVSKGRKWCDWYCPRGSFYDALMGVVSPKRRFPEFFKSTLFRAAVMVFLLSMLALAFISNWPDFAGIGSFLERLVTTTTIIGIVLALIYNPRSWCSFCPVGSMINWTGARKGQLKIDSGLCIDCKLCYKVCPMQIDPSSYKSDGVKTVNDRDCLRCSSCVKACPKKALSF